MLADRKWETSLSALLSMELGLQARPIQRCRFSDQHLRAASLPISCSKASNDMESSGTKTISLGASVTSRHIGQATADMFQPWTANAQGRLFTRIQEQTRPSWRISSETTAHLRNHPLCHRCCIRNEENMKSLDRFHSMCHEQLIVDGRRGHLGDALRDGSVPVMISAAFSDGRRLGHGFSDCSSSQKSSECQACN